MNFYGFFSVLRLLCLCARLFICALWSPAVKGLTSRSWLSFVVSYCEFVTLPLVSLVRCDTYLYQFLIFASLLTFIDFFLLKVIDNFKISKINVKIEHQFTAPFHKHLHKLPLCTLSLLILTTCTLNHVVDRLRFKSWQDICCHVIENVLKSYVNVTCTIQKKRDTSVVYA